MSVNRLNIKKFCWQLIINPIAWSKNCESCRESVEAFLKAEGIAYELHVTNRSDDGTEISRMLCLNGKRHFLVVGGDGTVNEIVNGIFQSGVDSSEVYMALIPMGTGNDWARSLAYPLEFEAKLDLFLEGKFMSHDVGAVSVDKNFKRYFINIAGFAFDAEVIYNAKRMSGRIFGGKIYLAALLKTLFTHKNRRLRIKSSEEVIEDNIFTMAVGIGQYNGNGIRQVPMAVPDSGVFDVVVIRKISLLKVIANVGLLFSGGHVEKLKEVSHFQTSSLEISSDPPVVAEVEGELLPTGNYKVDILPSALNVLTNLK